MTKNKEVVTFAIQGGYHVTVDRCDIDQANFFWETHITKSGLVYARRRIKENGKRRWIKLHCVILERKLGRSIDEHMDTDHIDRNALNNTRDNLREVTRSVNLHNKSVSKTSTSGIKGVRWHTRDRRWVSSFMVDGKYIHVGYFSTKEEAYLAYVKKRKSFGLDI